MHKAFLDYSSTNFTDTKKSLISLFLGFGFFTCSRMALLTASSLKSSVASFLTKKNENDWICNTSYGNTQYATEQCQGAPKAPSYRKSLMLAPHTVSSLSHWAHPAGLSWGALVRLSKMSLEYMKCRPFAFCLCSNLLRLGVRMWETVQTLIRGPTRWGSTDPHQVQPRSRRRRMQGVLCRV